MKLKYLGTAAAEGIPGLFCNCRVCRNALSVRGKEIKTRSQSLIDDRLLIDLPADTYMHILNYGLDLRKIHHCIITHNHSDHFYPNDLWCRYEGIAYDIGEEPIHVYVTDAGYKRAEAFHGKNIDSARLKLHRVKAFEAFDIEDYHIIPLAANHDPSSDPVFYIIEGPDKVLLYAHDTSVFPDSTWDFLKNYGKSFDLVSLDCNEMILPDCRYGHMGLDVAKEVYNRLIDMGLCTDKTKAYINHFSHNGKLTHAELEDEAEKYGFVPSYDGLEVEF